MEALNVHGNLKKFTIYPVAGAKKVDAYFPDRLFDIAISSVKKYLNLSGQLKYKRMAKFPHSIKVEAIEVFPDEEDLPSIMDIHGIAPNATGELSSEEFVRRLRGDG